MNKSDNHIKELDVQLENQNKQIKTYQEDIKKINKVIELKKIEISIERFELKKNKELVKTNNEQIKKENEPQEGVILINSIKKNLKEKIKIVESLYENRNDVLKKLLNVRKKYNKINNSKRYLYNCILRSNESINDSVIGLNIQGNQNNNQNNNKNTLRMRIKRLREQRMIDRNTRKNDCKQQRKLVSESFGKKKIKTKVKRGKNAPKYCANFNDINLEDLTNHNNIGDCIDSIRDVLVYVLEEKHKECFKYDSQIHFSDMFYVNTLISTDNISTVNANQVLKNENISHATKSAINKKQSKIDSKHFKEIYDIMNKFVSLNISKKSKIQNNFSNKIIFATDGTTFNVAKHINYDPKILKLMIHIK